MVAVPVAGGEVRVMVDPAELLNDPELGVPGVVVPVLLTVWAPGVGAVLGVDAGVVVEEDPPPLSPLPPEAAALVIVVV